MKKLMMVCMSLLMVVGLSGCGSDTKEETYKIGLVQLMKHNSLDTIRESILKQLETKGYKDGDNIKIDYQNAGGDTSTLNTIAEKFKSDGCDVIIAITTPAAQAAAPFAEEIPVIFSAVSDPKAAGLVDDIEKPGLNITGTSDEVQVNLILDLALETYPETKSIGYLYNSGEANSVANLKKVQKYADKNGLKVVESAVANAADIQTGMQKLIDEADIIFSPTDNTVASAMAQVSELAKQAKIPVFSGADSMVQDGAFATYGINYVNLGKETANMAIKVLTGTKVKDIPVMIFKKGLNVYINKTTAEAIGFTGTDALKEKYEVSIFE